MQPLRFRRGGGSLEFEADALRRPHLREPDLLDAPLADALLDRRPIERARAKPFDLAEGEREDVVAAAKFSGAQELGLDNRCFIHDQAGAPVPNQFRKVSDIGRNQHRQPAIQVFGKFGRR